MGLDDLKVVEGGLLGGLGLDLLDQWLEVGHILLRLCPFRPGEDLLLQTELRRAAQAVDAVVRFRGVQGLHALEGLDDGLVLLGDQIIGTIWGGRICLLGRSIFSVSLLRRRGQLDWGRGQFLPEAELAVRGSIGVPVGEGLDEFLQPRPLDDEVGKVRGRHGDCFRGSRVVWEREAERW